MNNLRNLGLWILIAVLLVFLFNLFQGTGTHATASTLSYSKFNEQVVQNQVRKVTFQGEQVKGELISGQTFTTTVPANDTTLWPMLKAHNVDTAVTAADEGMPSLVGEPFFACSCFARSAFAALLLAFGICGLHFTAMASATSARCCSTSSGWMLL